ncbi:MAG: N-acetyltransferase [Alphaproteobacteria bacterium]|nr:N-acetyltransferase [Alphaproteobacteria bacterium]MBU2085901.1 N-acetyltransferase [Alphaproteobacteria bacterium]MBU2142880.1 N-acetyltransferase [Alphaproteobacteria bacterium]MBU2195921.1 N-acetyltransferase [Alphaproteobacteria bacterium]
MSDAEIKHDKDARRYSVVIEGTEAYLTYERPTPDRIHVTHTIVPDAIGGRGLGKRLVTRAMEDAIAAGDKVSSSCWYASGLIEKTPEWSAQLA